jgi:hypothetical protein
MRSSISNTIAQPVLGGKRAQGRGRAAGVQMIVGMLREFKGSFGSIATEASLQQVKPRARRPESGRSGARAAPQGLDAQRIFEPFSLAEACD